jgi:excisionase family DNA binding protein
MPYQRKSSPLLSTDQAAEALGVTDSTIRRWVEKGYLRARRMPSGTYKFAPEEVQRLAAQIERGERLTTQQEG